MIPRFLLHPASARRVERVVGLSFQPAVRTANGHISSNVKLFLLPPKKKIIKARDRWEKIYFLPFKLFFSPFIFEGKGSAVFLLEYEARLSGFSFTAALYDQEAARSIFYESVRC